MQGKDKVQEEKPVKSAGWIFAKRWDLWVLVGVLLLAGLLWLFFTTGKNESGMVEITIGQGKYQQIREISLEKDRVIRIEAKLPVELEIKNGQIRFINSVCPDHDCENFGSLSHEGDWAACLPAEVVVRVVKEPESKSKT